ncbi:MAG: hypothetical protein ACR2J8_15620 [Thermomicrobiales bacterium]
MSTSDAALSIPAPSISLPSTPREGRRSRMSVADLIAIAACVIAMLLGLWLIRAHDSRVAVNDIDGMAVTHPVGWLQAPAVAPAVATWVDAAGSGATLTVYRIPTDVKEIAGSTTVTLNPASSSAAFTPLESRSVEVPAGAGEQSEYAYVRQRIGRGLAPAIVQGRQVAWIENGELRIVALEAPEEAWDDTLRDAGRALPGGGA